MVLNDGFQHLFQEIVFLCQIHVYMQQYPSCDPLLQAGNVSATAPAPWGSTFHQRGGINFQGSTVGGSNLRRMGGIADFL